MVELKQGGELEAHRRMIKAGYKPRSIRARFLQIAQERNLPQIDVNRALKAASTNRDCLLDLAVKHQINLNWLFYGDIRGLIAMRRDVTGGAA